MNSYIIILLRWKEPNPNKNAVEEPIAPALETATAVPTANARRAPALAALQWRKNVPAKIADVDKAANAEITAPVNPNDPSSLYHLFPT